MEAERRSVPIVIGGAAISLAAALFAVVAAASSSADEASSSVTSEPPSSTPAITATARFEIEIAGFQFGPQQAVVQAGTEVVWTNADTDVHSIISTGELFPSSDVFDNGERYSVVFTEPGTYAYTCGIHPSMSGTITVEA